MKKNLCKVLCLLAVLTLIMSAIPALGESVANDPGSLGTAINKMVHYDAPPVKEDTASYTEVGTYAPLANEPVELTIMMPIGASVEDMETNAFTVWLDETTNVKVNWIAVPQANWAEQRNAMLASGDYPDILMCTGWSNSELSQYVDEGILLPLNYYIENSMPGYQSFLSTRGNLLEQTVSPDGNIYALANGNNCYHARVGSYKAFISQSFLTAVSGQNPTTTDELYELLVKFRDMDPNGDGIKNEIPLTGVSNELRTWLINAFCYDPVENCHCWVNNGVVECAWTSDAYREALRYIKKLYDEQLIDPTFLTITAADIKAMTASSSGNVIGMAVSNTNDTIATSGSDAYYDFMNMCPPIAGPENVQYSYWNYENSDYNAAVIFSTCEYPELASRWLDNFYANWELCFNSRFGPEGEKWQWCSDGEPGLDGSPAIWKKIAGLAIDTLQNTYWGGNSMNGCFEHTTQADNVDGMEGFLFTNVQNYEVYKPDYSMYLPRNLWLDTEAAAEKAELQIALQNYMNNSFASFIKGNMSIEDDWDQYLNELNNIGLEDYMVLLQSAYDLTK